ncbi:MAG: MFS transporter [Pseudobdellovibrio sp.]
MNTDFRKLLIARFLYTFAVQMQAVILGWRIYDLLKDPLSLGFIGLVEAIPAISLALYAGYIVDRSRPLLVYRRVIYVSLLSGILVLSEHLLQSQFTILTQATLLYSASFLTGLARSFAMPVIFASLPRLVPRNELMRASAKMSSAMQIARIAGPACGGIAFGFFGVVISSSIVCVLLLCSSVAMLLIKTEISPPATLHKHASIKDELLSGAKFVFSHPILLPALSLDMISVLFGGVTALLPIFAKEILFIGPKGLGALRAAPAIGAAAMAFYLSKSNFIKKNSGRWLLSVVAGFGICILIFGMSHNYILSLSALAFSGAFDSVSMVIRSAAVQFSSPDHMRGKISAVNSIFIGSSNEIGEFESGIAAKIFGTVPAVYIGGIICLATVGIAAYLSPKLLNLDLEKLENQA